MSRFIRLTRGKEVFPYYKRFRVFPPMEKLEDTSGEEEVKESEGDPEKDFFEMQIDQLKRQLEDGDVRLQQRRETLADVRSRLDSETDSRQACLSHLRRVLAFETDRRLEVQEKLQTLREQSEWAEGRVLGKSAATEKSREATKSQFLQQKLELEGKLSLLEELRLKRNSQLVHLKRVEEALDRKGAALREKSREEDMRQVDGLLRRREEFLQKCRQIRGEWREAFRLRMPVHSKEQLGENVRLRKVCERDTERLLQVQRQSRELKTAEKSMELQEEIQTSAEDDAGQRKRLQEERLQHLLSARGALRPQKFTEGCSDMSGRCNAVESALRTDEGEPERQRESIAEMGAERCRLRDRLDEAMAILEDQADYRSSLEERLEESADKNGLSMSHILRAGKILEGRRRNGETDFDLLQQIRFLLDLASNEI